VLLAVDVRPSVAQDLLMYDIEPLFSKLINMH